MKPFLVILGVLLALLLAGVAHSHADTNVGNGLCMTGPYNSVDVCPSPTSPGRSPIVPEKVLAVGGPIPAPAGVTYYPVDITSRVACFPLGEPIDVYALGGGGSAVLHQVTAGPSPAQNSGVVVARVDPTTATARLALEVVRQGIGPAGLVVKAVWPQEQIERLARVVDPASPTVTPTLIPGASPWTSAATPTNTPQTPTGTPGPTATNAPSAVPLFARACVDPRVAAPNTPGTVYVQTVPGAACSASVRFDNGGAPRTFNGSSQVAGTDGFALFPFERSSTPSGGTVTIRCTRGTESVSAATTFNAAQ